MNANPPAAPGGCPGGEAVLPPPGACRASEVLGRVGDKWSLQVIFSLGGGTRRFTDLKRGIDGISQRMLTVTLRGLERDGIVTRTMYPVVPPRVDYALTPMGRTLLDVACNLIGWVDDHLDEIDAARAAYDARDRAGSGAFSA
jgi:DNA-binding HxlR family transcriptional regulator